MHQIQHSSVIISNIFRFQPGFAHYYSINPSLDMENGVAPVRGSHLYTRLPHRESHGTVVRPTSVFFSGFFHVSFFLGTLNIWQDRTDASEVLSKIKQC